MARTQGQKAGLVLFPPALNRTNAERTWVDLQPGERVLVREGSGYEFQAHVDESTADSTSIWVIPTNVGCRRIFHITDEVHITVLPPLKPKSPTT
jgi:hypothetical protein